MFNSSKMVKIFLISMLLLISGCTSIPEKESGIFNLDKGKYETSELIANLARKCWFDKSSIIVNQQIIRDKQAITAGGAEFFFIAVVSGSDEKSTITTHEGDYRCGFRGCWSLNLTDDIKRWSNGDHSCRPEQLKVAE